MSFFGIVIRVAGFSTFSGVLDMADQNVITRLEKAINIDQVDIVFKINTVNAYVCLFPSNAEHDIANFTSVSFDGHDYFKPPKPPSRGRISSDFSHLYLPNASAACIGFETGSTADGLTLFKICYVSETLIDESEWKMGESFLCENGAKYVITLMRRSSKITVVEQTSAPLIKNPTEEQIKRIESSKSERLRLLNRNDIGRTYDILGEGTRDAPQSYNITIGLNFVCTCPDFRFRRIHCKHICYVLVCCVD
jgi:hypothetical protein